MNELVRKLSASDTAVTVRGNVEELKAAIDRAYVLVKFTETRGGTELGFRLEQEYSDLSSGNFDEGSGSVRLAGKLNLDGVDVRCVADVNLETLTGKGHLEILEDETPN